VTIARASFVVFVAFVLQVSFVSRLSAFGVRGDLLLLVTIAAGMAGDAEKGAIVGFCAGLTFDIVLNTPLGLSALVYTLVGYAVGAVQGSVLHSGWWVPSAVAALASAGAVVMYGLLGEALGQATLSGPPLLTILVVVAVENAILAPVAIRAMRWVFIDSSQRRFLAR
jgi:rod shape-determining protein MreD